MAQIQVLDSGTIDKIAAGEVVERPLSVVKELVENALDAGSTAITVETKEGGIEFIRVTDNGSGIEESQVRSAFLRHATSKIRSAEDLTHVVSLGFRGEALSSISAVSKVEIITKTKDKLTGTHLVLEGGVEKLFEEIGAPDGTTFLMRNLFYNTPVRRKFLKQPQTEGSYIAELMEHMALSRPDVSFKLLMNGQVRFHTSGNGDLREVIYRIYGKEVSSNLVPVSYESSGICIRGYLGKPVLNRSNRNFETYFINNRYIRSNLVAKAIEEGYKEYLMQHKFPFTVLHFEVNTEMVDVNVHPTKMDVRFTNSLEFYNHIIKAVSTALKQQEMIPEAVLDETQKAGKANSLIEKIKAPEPFEEKRSREYRVMEESRYEAEKIKETGRVQLQIPVPKPQLTEDFPKVPEIEVGNPAKVKSPEGISSETQIKENNSEEDTFFFEDSEPKKAISATGENVPVSAESISPKELPSAETTEISTEPPVQMNLFEEKMLDASSKEEYRILGQIFDTYWLVAFRDKLFIVDQHAAHEKVKYEALIKQYREKTVVSQTLNPPIVVSLTAREEQILAEYGEIFQSMGFEIEEFGGREYALRSVPTDLYGCDEREMFTELLDELSESPLSGNLTVVEEKIASMSCKAAVKGNHSMSVREMEALLDLLLTLENPYNCPHGRPTIISMSKYEIEKKFKRIV